MALLCLPFNTVVHATHILTRDTETPIRWSYAGQLFLYILQIMQPNVRSLGSLQPTSTNDF